MRFSKKQLILPVVLVIAFIAAWFYREYQRKPGDISNEEPFVKAAAVNVVDLYGQDETKANAQWLGKMIQVSGTICEIDNQHDTLVNVLIGDQASMHKVSCLLDKRHAAEIKNYAAGRQIIIKGICTGYLIDVELNRCVIVPEN